MISVVTQGLSDFFTCFLSTTSEKLFIRYKPSATVQAHKSCPVRPIVLLYVQFGQESCPAGEYLQLKNKKIKVD